MNRRYLCRWATLAAFAISLVSCASVSQPLGPASTASAARSQVSIEDDQLAVGETPWWQIPASPTSGTSKARLGDLGPERHFVLSGSVLFEPDAPELTPGASSQLSIILEEIQALPNARMMIDGHTNKVPDESEDEALKLSIGRAEAVKAWYAAHGVRSDKLIVHGWGSARPLYPSDTEEHRAANRRCEITIVRN